jgi:hypothetical protein
MNDYVHDQNTSVTPLPSGWAEVVDPTSGELYYFNEVENITSWERPFSETAKDNIEFSNENEENENPDSGYKDNIDNGWTKVLDPQSGDFYYFNEKTQETSWEKPEVTLDFTVENEDVLSNGVDIARVSVSDSGPGQPLLNVTEVIDTLDGFCKTLAECLEPDDKAAVSSEFSQGIRESIVELDQNRQSCGIDGSLIAAPESDVLVYIRGKAQKSGADLLWQLIGIAAQSKGRLRSDDGVHNESSPESAIVKILLNDSSRASSVSQLRSSGDNIVVYHEKGTLKSSNVECHKFLRRLTAFLDDAGHTNAKQKVEELIMRGRRREAVEEAIQCGDYATALLVATMCDTETYRRATIAFAQNAFPSDSPMTTVAMLFSGALQVPESGLMTTDLWGVSANELKASWKRHLAGIISNRIVGWDSIVLSLGDRLIGCGEIIGAHFCYMICGCPISSPLREGTRLCLLGSNHTLLTERTLLSPEAIESFERTEAYEWAKRQGNKNATLTSFQPFKMIFACHLVDAGLLHRAKSYLHGFRMLATKAEFQRPKALKATLSDILDSGPGQILLLRQLDEKLGSILMTQDNQIQKIEVDAVQGNAKNEIAFQNLKTRAKSEATSSVAVDGPRCPSPSEWDTTFVSARSNLMDVTGYTVDTPEKTAASSNPAQSPRLETRDPKSSTFPDSFPTKRKTLEDASREPRSQSIVKPSESLPTPRSPARQARDPKHSPASVPKTSKQLENASQVPTLESTSKPSEIITTPQPRVAERPKAAPSTAPSVLIGNKTAHQSRQPAPSSSEKSKSRNISCMFQTQLFLIT